MTLIQEHEGPDVYAQVPLEDAASSIRLLHLQPQTLDSEESAIECRMESCPLSEVPDYYAISYTWGDPSLQTTILVNGQPFTVRRSCYYALWQARFRCPESYIWIDSVCINQADLDEKAAQVALMASIYASSQEVLACIGESDEDSDAVGQAAEKLGEEASRMNFDFDEDQVFPCFATWIREHKKDYLPKVLLSYQRFCERPYFSRLWIAQELHAGDIYVTFLCGKNAINWQDLWLLDDVMATYCAMGTGWSMSTIGKLRSLLEAPGDAAHPFPAYLMWAKELLCQEPRDRVYGTLGVIDWAAHDLKAPIPDYRRPTWDIGIDLLSMMLSIRRPYLSEADYIASALRLTKDDPRAIAWMDNKRSIVADDGLTCRNAWRFQATNASAIVCDHNQRLTASFSLGVPGPPQLNKPALDQLLSQEQHLYCKTISPTNSARNISSPLVRVYTYGRLSALVNGPIQDGDILIDLNQLDLGSTTQRFALAIRPASDDDGNFIIIGTGILVDSFALEEFHFPCQCFGTMVEDDAIMRSAEGLWCEIEAESDAVLILGSLAKESLHTEDVGEVLAIVATCIGTTLRVTSLIKIQTGEVEQRPMLKHLLEEHRKPNVDAQVIDGKTDLGQYQGIVPSVVMERWADLKE